MTIDWNEFTPWAALSGGALIGLAASASALLCGRIAGISAILGGLLRPSAGDVAWRLAFVLGIVVAPMAGVLVAPVPVPKIDSGLAGLVAAGLLVGVGTRHGSGCTSGHGVCGRARLSPRSLVATLSLAMIGAMGAFEWLQRRSAH